MALQEMESDRKPRKRLDTALYSGWAYHRRYKCPTGSLDTDIAALTLGRVLPSAEGGVATTTMQDPRLAAMQIDEKASGLMTYIDATYIQIDVTDTEHSGTFKETTKTRKTITHPHGEQMSMIGIATSSSDAGIPARGYTEAGALPTVYSDWCCSDIRLIDNWQAARTLALATFVKSRAQSAT